MTVSRIIKIAICADRLSAAMMSSIVAARLPNGSCQIDLFINEPDKMGSDIYARPNIRHVHQLLQITETELANFAGGRMILAIPTHSEQAGFVQLPLGDFGYPIQGCAFQHYWFRAFEAKQAMDLDRYNFALRLSEKNISLATAPEGCPNLSPGYIFKSEAYAELLFSRASQLGSLETKSGNVRLHEISDNQICFLVDEKINDYDLVLHVPIGENNFSLCGWSGNYVRIHPDRDLAGLFLYQVQSALERIFNIWSQSSDNQIECREYNRLLNAENEHIQDMKSLLTGEGAKGQSDRLNRKVNLFQSMGRIPFEDFDVFSNAEWIAAMRAVGVKSQGYNRLADRLTLDDIAKRLSALDKSISTHLELRGRA